MMHRTNGVRPVAGMNSASGTSRLLACPSTDPSIIAVRGRIRNGRPPALTATAHAAYITTLTACRRPTAVTS